MIGSFEDLDVYKKLVELHLKVHELTMGFPKYEMFELGSQVRRIRLPLTSPRDGTTGTRTYIWKESTGRSANSGRPDTTSSWPHEKDTFRKEWPKIFSIAIASAEECFEALNALSRNQSKGKQADLLETSAL